MPFALSALLTGALLALAIPPLPLGPLLPLILAFAFHSLMGLSPKRAALWGFVSGIPQYAGSLFWILSVGKVGPVLLIIPAVLLLVAYMSAWSAVWAWLFSLCARRKRGLLLFPFVWAGIEILRTRGELAFPWEHLGYDLGGHVALIQGAAWIGVFGMGLLLVASGLLLAAAWERRLPRLTAAGVLGFWILWAVAGWRISQDVPAGPSFKVAVVQPAVPQTKKWNEAYFAGVMEKTFAAGRRVQTPVDLVAFPETAMPDYWPLRPLQTLRLGMLSDSLRTDLVIGALDFDRDEKSPKGAWIRNSAFLLSPGQGKRMRSDKIFLVPFGERVPFDWLPLVSQVDLEQGGFSAGHEMMSHVTAGVPWAPSLCYEVIYPQLLRKVNRVGARVLVNLTNDGWFGQSIGPWQHFNIQRFRAVESGVALVRAANTGVSAIADSRGNILAQSRLMSDTVLEARVTAGPMGGSFYARNGGWIEMLLLGLAIASLAGLRFLARV